MSTTTQGKTPAPGQYFDVPGIGGGTQWTDQYDSTVSLATVMSQSNQVPVNGIIQFRQTDVVVDVAHWAGTTVFGWALATASKPKAVDPAKKPFGAAIKFALSCLR